MGERRQILVLNSITHAYKARDYLHQRGIQAYVERIPSELRVSGCGYGVRVNNDGELIAQMLDQAGIKVRSILKL